MQENIEQEPEYDDLSDHRSSHWSRQLAKYLRLGIDIVVGLPWCITCHMNMDTIGLLGYALVFRWSTTGEIGDRFVEPHWNMHS